MTDAPRPPAQEARRRKLELRLLLGVEALLTTQELCDIFAIRESEIQSWVKRLPVHVVAGKQHYRYGDVVKMSRVGDESASQPAPARGGLKRATLPTSRAKKTG